MNRARLAAASGVAVLVCLIIQLSATTLAASAVPSDASESARLRARLLAQASTEVGGTDVVETGTNARSTAQRPIMDVNDVTPASAPATHESPPSMSRRETLIASLTIFLLAVFLGFELINKVPPTLHTPLMSGSNAISGITLVGALFAAGLTKSGWFIPTLGFLAVVMATVNAVGGFAVTHRMLSMFRRN